VYPPIGGRRDRASSRRAPPVAGLSIHLHWIQFSFSVLPACYQDAKGRYRIGGGQITLRRAYLDQGGTTPLLRAYAIDCPRCSC
jgi:hypothetical protein